MKRKLAAAFLSLCIPLSVYASCPDLDAVTFKCQVVAGKKHCGWTAAWWEGYQGTVEEGEHPAQFVEALWHVESDDPNMGFADCFYRDRVGGLVTLSQNSWGGIPLPDNTSIWQPGYWPDNPASEGLVCVESPGTCSFQYGSK